MVLYKKRIMALLTPSLKNNAILDLVLFLKYLVLLWPIKVEIMTARGTISNFGKREFDGQHQRQRRFKVVQLGFDTSCSMLVRIGYTG